MKKLFAILFCLAVATSAMAQRGGSRNTSSVVMNACASPLPRSCPAAGYVCRDSDKVIQQCDSGTWTASTVADGAIIESKLDALDTPADGECLAFDSVTGRLEWVVCGSGGSATLAGHSDTGVVTPAAAEILIYDGLNSWDNKLPGGDVTVTAEGVFTIGADKVALQTDTTGNYVAGVTTNQGLLMAGTEAATLGFIDCAASEIMKRNVGDTAWECGSDTAGTGGSPVKFDIGDDGGDDSLDVTEFATSGDTNSIFTEPLDDKIFVNLALNWPSADTADALDANPTNCAANNVAAGIANTGIAEGCVDPILETELTNEATLETQVGGLDVVFGTEIATFALLDAIVADQDLVGIDQVNTFTLNQLVDGTTNSIQLVVQGHTTQSVDVLVVEKSDGTDLFTVANDGTTTLGGTTSSISAVSGQDLDISVSAGQNMTFGDGGVSNYVQLSSTGAVTFAGTADLDLPVDSVDEADLKAVDTPAEGECLTFTAVGGDFEWKACGSGGGAFADADPIVQNTTGNDVHIGVGAATLVGKLEVGGDADQPQLVVEGFSSQTDSLAVFQQDGGTEVATVDNGGLVSSLAGYDVIGPVDMDMGSADVLDFTVLTDDTGDGEVVLPDDSIGPGEIDSTAGAYDFGGVTSLEIPNGTTAPTVDAAGEISIDTNGDLTNIDTPYLQIRGSAASGFIFTVPEIPTVDAAVLTFNATNDDLEWTVPSGTGDVTAVGPGCAAGLCFTDGLVTAGTVLLNWEGTTADANDFTLNVPADPGSQMDLTLPSATDTLVGKATTDTFTNKTFDCDGTGNSCSNIDLSADVTGTAPVGNGGTGAITLTDGGMLFGSGAGAITALAVAGNGQIPIGDAVGDPVLATITGTASEITVTNGPGTITLDLPNSITLTDPVFSTSAQLPNGAAPVVNAAGELAIDTTNVPATGGNDQLVVYDGTAAVAIPLTDYVCATVENLAAADDDYIFWTAPYAVTVTSAYCVYQGTASLAATVDLQDGENNAMTMADATCVDGDSSTRPTVQSVTAANALVAGESLGFNVTNAVAPENMKTTICITYKVTRQ